MNPVLSRLGGYPLAAFQDMKRELVAEGEDVADFSIGDPIEPTPAFIRQALVDALDPVSQYPTAAGLPELRRAIASWVQRRFGVTVDPDREVLPTAGSKEAIFHLPLGLVDATSDRRVVVWGTPGYPVYERGQLFAGGESYPVSLDARGEWKLQLDAIDSDVLSRTSHAWLNYPHNPTGATMTIADYRKARETARRHGIVLASDECYVDVYPDGRAPEPSLLQATGDPSQPDLSGVIVAFSLSKRSGMTGYRCGALVGDPELLAAQRIMRPNIGTGSPEFVQHAAVAAWSEDEHVGERRRTFDAKRRVVLAFLQEAGIAISGSDATFYIWAEVPGGDDEAYAKALLQHRVIVSPGSAFGPAGRGWMRLALVPDLDGCHLAVEAWRRAITSGSLPG